MKVDRIKCTKEFSYHGFSEWIGMEASIEEHEDAVEQELLLRQKLIDTFNQVLSEKNVPVIEQKKGKPVSDEIQAVLDGINACTVMEGEDGLKSFWMPSKTNLILSQAYTAKLKLLQDGADKK